jgi:Flp pilus assembly protein TadG
MSGEFTVATSKVFFKIRSRSKRVSAGNERGGAVIEFTLIMPVLLLTMTGMAAFGFAIHNEIVLTNAVNTGAQLLAFSRGQTTDPCATASSAINSAGPSLVSGLSLSFVFTPVSGGSTYSYGSTTSCAAAATYMVQSGSVQVTGTYPCALGVYGESFTCLLRAQTTEFIQ